MMNAPKTTNSQASIEVLKAAASITIGQLGQSLDGRIATSTGHSKYINDHEGLMHLHDIRASMDAVIVGVGTVLADDPLLTVRLCQGKSPARIIIDPNHKAKETAQLFNDDDVKCIILGRAGDKHPFAKLGEDNRIEFLPIKAEEGKLDPAAIKEALMKRGYKKLLIEGGSHTVSAFLQAKCLDRLHLIVAPVIIGSGFPGLCLQEIATVDKAVRPAVTRYQLGQDTLFDCEF